MNPVVKTIERHKQANKSIKATTGKMSKIYTDARERLNEKLQRYVLSHANPAYGTWFVELINELERNYAKLEEKFVEEMGRAIPYVAESYYREALNDIGKSIIGKLDKAKIELFRKDAFTHIAGMTTNMQKSDVAWLRQTAADVFRLAGVGGMTAQETKQMMLAKILMRPEKFQFTDAGGRMWDNKTYCEMLARTVLLNAGRQTYFDTCAENGNDVVRVTVSGNACPACAVWENRLLSISGATPGLPTVEEATNAGLCHPNCTHSFVAVPDYVRGEDFTENGRPKKGLNSPDNVIKDDKEAWKKYRDSLKPKKRKISDSDREKAKSGNVTPENKKVGSKSLKTANKGIPETEQPNLYQSMTTNNQEVNKSEQKIQETREEHRARRQKQWEEAYNNRRDKWYQSIIDAGGSKEIAGELADLYTPEMAKLGKPPKKIVFSTEEKACYKKEIIEKGKPIKENKPDELHLHFDPNNWYGCRATAQHEFGHWIHHKYLGKNKGFRKEIAIAAQKDWAGNKKIFQRVAEFSKEDQLNLFSNPIFGRDCRGLELNQQYSISGIFDTIGSISNGDYGFGHDDYDGKEGEDYEKYFGTKNYYKLQNGYTSIPYGEAIANVFSAQDFIDKKKLKLVFPNLYDIVQKMMGKIK